ncbi:glycosyl transferase family 1 [Rhizobium oryziradicis]|uniref:Glycosyl transferase family 1 n=1 Tax=Rhizobium oryziradicis TaxID=1867956 RepID=A0A1Q8ZTM8_9HYPH|nr:glycosyl transferase family 1 [Rhizobium oryziradicis]OLP45402.1 glycosyl transferase family 1 [Rhizobium oryziradicis]
MTLRVLYLAHDLADPAIRRRVLMLRAGGAEVMLAGFRRDENALAAVEGIQPIELGTTSDGQFVQRAVSVVKASLLVKSKLGHLPRPDVIIARNLEMLSVAYRARHIFGSPVPMVYECLDIHRLMLRKDVIGSALRSLEGRFSRDASLLITSSPAFVEHYFKPLSDVDLPVMLLENKVLDLEDNHGAASVSQSPPTPEQPWKIGWFGALRCAKSLKLLSDFTRAMEGRVVVDMRGRPAHGEFDDFDALIAREPYISFHGAYRNPEDLADIYSQIHFVWAIDFYEEGQNSSWLLPNRLYEGCRHGGIPIALKGTETAHYLNRKAIGFEIGDASVAALTSLFETMTTERCLQAVEHLNGQDPRNFTLNKGDCETFVARLSALPAPHSRATMARQKPAHSSSGPATVPTPKTSATKVDVHDG